LLGESVPPNAVFLTAGHCIGGTQYTVEFSCPPSTASGAVVHPVPGSVSGEQREFGFHERRDRKRLGGLHALRQHDDGAIAGRGSKAGTTLGHRASLRSDRRRVFPHSERRSQSVLNQAPTTHVRLSTAVTGTQLQYTVDTTGWGFGFDRRHGGIRRSAFLGIHTNAGMQHFDGRVPTPGTYAVQLRSAGPPRGTSRSSGAVSGSTVSQLGRSAIPITIAARTGDAPASAELVNASSRSPCRGFPEREISSGRNAGPGAGGDVFMPFTLPPRIRHPVPRLGARRPGPTAASRSRCPTGAAIGTITFDIRVHRLQSRTRLPRLLVPVTSPVTCFALIL
jgi:hypothetical protein